MWSTDNLLVGLPEGLQLAQASQTEDSMSVNSHDSKINLAKC